MTLKEQLVVRIEGDIKRQLNPECRDQLELFLSGNISGTDTAWFIVDELELSRREYRHKILKILTEFADENKIKFKS